MQAQQVLPYNTLATIIAEAITNRIHIRYADDPDVKEILVETIRTALQDYFMESTHK